MKKKKQKYTKSLYVLVLQVFKALFKKRDEKTSSSFFYSIIIIKNYKKIE